MGHDVLPQSTVQTSVVLALDPGTDFFDHDKGLVCVEGVEKAALKIPLVLRMSQFLCFWSVFNKCYLCN